MGDQTGRKERKRVKNNKNESVSSKLTRKDYEAELRKLHVELVKLQECPEEQTKRLEARIDDGRKIWKLSARDLKSYARWDDYSKARDDMFLATDTCGHRGTSPDPTTKSAPGSTSSATY